MSTRWHFISRRPNSKTANRPTGPAPIMRASVWCIFPGSSIMGSNLIPCFIIFKIYMSFERLLIYGYFKSKYQS